MKTIKSTKSTKTHNLNIHMYKLSEILELFDISHEISIENLKHAKKKVLMTHPDKSGLGSEYFLFYKKAFDIVVNLYEEQQKEFRILPKEEIKYVPENLGGLNKASVKKINSIVNEMPNKEFQQRFNQLFEENMSKKIDDGRNAWFKEEKSSIEIDGVINKQNMNEMFEKIKSKQSSSILSNYRGFENLHHNQGSQLYDDSEDNDSYVVCDPFSKLKFDDLRKVHKDQPIIAVSERDLSNMPKYSSVDHFIRERGKQNVSPLDNQQSEQMLEIEKEEYKKRLMQKEHQEKLRTMEYENKNKSILANFLRLT